MQEYNCRNIEEFALVLYGLLSGDYWSRFKGKILAKRMDEAQRKAVLAFYLKEGFINQGEYDDVIQHPFQSNGFRTLLVRLGLQKPWKEGIKDGLFALIGVIVGIILVIQILPFVFNILSILFEKLSILFEKLTILFE